MIFKIGNRIIIWHKKPLHFFFLREGKGGREEEKHWYEREHRSVASHMHLSCGPNLQPRHVPWLRIEPATFHFAGPCPTIWAILVMAKNSLFNKWCHKNLIFTCKRAKLELYSNTMWNFNSKWIKDQNLRVKRTTLLDWNIGTKHDPRSASGFLYMIPKEKSNKRKNINWSSSKLKFFWMKGHSHKI